MRSGMQRGASRGRPHLTSYSEGDGVAGRRQEGEKHFGVRWEKKMETLDKFKIERHLPVTENDFLSFSFLFSEVRFWMSTFCLGMKMGRDLSRF